MIIGFSFQCFFMTTLTHPKYFKEINTIEDLRDSGMVVYCWRKLMNHIRPEDYGLQKQIVFVDGRKILNMMSDLDLPFVAAQSRAIILAKTKNLHVVREALAVGYSVYFFQKNSPYLEEVRRSILLTEEFGLGESRKRGRHNLDNKTVDEVLNLYHLQGVFLILLYGHLLSGVVFVLEMVLNRIPCK